MLRQLSYRDKSVLIEVRHPADILGQIAVIPLTASVQIQVRGSPDYCLSDNGLSGAGYCRFISRDRDGWVAGPSGRGFQLHRFAHSLRLPWL